MSQNEEEHPLWTCPVCGGSSYEALSGRLHMCRNCEVVFGDPSKFCRRERIVTYDLDDPTAPADSTRMTRVVGVREENGVIQHVVEDQLVHKQTWVGAARGTDKSTNRDNKET